MEAISCDSICVEKTHNCKYDILYVRQKLFILSFQTCDSNLVCSLALCICFIVWSLNYISQLRILDLGSWVLGSWSWVLSTDRGYWVLALNPSSRGWTWVPLPGTLKVGLKTRDLDPHHTRNPTPSTMQFGSKIFIIGRTIGPE